MLTGLALAAAAIAAPTPQPATRAVAVVRVRIVRAVRIRFAAPPAESRRARSGLIEFE